MQPSLVISVEQSADGANYQLIKFDGEFDKIGYSNVREELNASISTFSDPKSESLKFLVFDFSKLKFINSEAIGYLMEIHTHLLNLGKKLVIVGLGAHVKDVFEAIGINQIMAIYPDLESFLKK